MQVGDAGEPGGELGRGGQGAGAGGVAADALEVGGADILGEDRERGSRRRRRRGRGRRAGQAGRPAASSPTTAVSASWASARRTAWRSGRLTVVVEKSGSMNARPAPGLATRTISRTAARQLGEIDQQALGADAVEVRVRPGQRRGVTGAEEPSIFKGLRRRRGRAASAMKSALLSIPATGMAATEKGRRDAGSRGRSRSRRRAGCGRARSRRGRGRAPSAPAFSSAMASKATSAAT